jgi:hypothetical protein
MCEHLLPLENELKSLGIRETYRGQPWSDNCREWVYFDCVLDVDSLRARFQLPAFVEAYQNDDERSGLEAGLVCAQCHDAIVGVHPRIGASKQVFS